jgi:hypothetical protein
MSTTLTHLVPLAEAEEWEGGCPECPAVCLVDEDGAVTEHYLPTEHGRPLCTGSGKPAIDVHERPHWTVEGVQWL